MKRTNWQTSQAINFEMYLYPHMTLDTMEPNSGVNRRSVIKKTGALLGVIGLSGCSSTRNSQQTNGGEQNQDTSSLTQSEMETENPSPETTQESPTPKTHERNNLDFEITYNTGDFSEASTTHFGTPPADPREGTACSGEEVIQVVDHPESPDMVAQHKLQHCDVRSEVVAQAGSLHETYWYGWQYYIPEDFDQETWTICAQWLCWPCEGIEKPCGGGTAKLDVLNDGWFLFQQGADGEGGSECHIRNRKIADLTRGEWTNFVARIHWSGDDRGRHKLWMNGEELVDYSGPTYWNDVGEESDPVFKVGAYRGGGNWQDTGDPEPLLLYTDNIRVGGSSASYDDVVPPER
jgi:hypothetical protein